MAEFLGTYWLQIVAVVVVGAVATLVFFATRKRNVFEDLLKKVQTRETEEETVKKAPTPTSLVKPSSPIGDVEKIKSDLRAMDVEKEIVGYALSRLYEAESEGKITEIDRSQLLEKYKDEMQHLEKEIEKKQMIVKLHDLEETKASLVEMLHSKLDDINKNIENIKVTLDISSPEAPQAKPQPAKQTEAPSPKVKREEEKTAPKPRAKSKAEERIEAIQEEVLKALERLEQIETEE